MKSAKPVKLVKPPRMSKRSQNIAGPARVVSPDFAPVPRRTSRPRWLDARIIGGLLLVVIAVVVGARVIGASSRTTPVWAAAHDMAVGTVLTQADLAEVQVNLGDNADRYLAADPRVDSVVGHQLTASVQAGELLPLSALTTAPSGKIIVIQVAAGKMPTGVTHGSKVDLYLTAANAGSSTRSTTELLASDITVQGVTVPSSGGLSGATSNTYQLSVLLDAATADRLVRVLPGGDALVVLDTGK